jgi:hypothetical protein
MRPSAKSRGYPPTRIAGQHGLRMTSRPSSPSTALRAPIGSSRASHRLAPVSISVRSLNAVAIGYEDEAESSSDVSVQSFDAHWPVETGDPLIILLDSCGNVNDEVHGLRRLDVNRAVERGARVVLVAGPSIAAGLQSTFVTWLMAKFGISITPRPQLEIRSEISRLGSYFSQQFCHATVGDNAGLANLPRDGQLLATAISAEGLPQGTASSRWSCEDSEVVFLPQWKPGAPGALDTVLSVLGQLPPKAGYPDYLDAFELGNEAELRKELALLETRATEIGDLLAEFRRSKGVLYLTSFDLEREVARLLTELGIPTEQVPGNREDLRMLDPSGDVWAIGEVKASESGTIERTALGKVDDHRKEAGHPLDFPALLVVSAFRGRQSVRERDKVVPPNIVKRSVEDHTLIVRTLDLIRLKQLQLAGKPAADQLEDAIRRGGGWFEVKPDLSISVRQG